MNSPRKQNNMRNPPLNRN